MAFSTSRTEALMRIKGTIKVQSLFSPFYNVSVLVKYRELSNQANNSKLNKFIKEYKSKYEKDLNKNRVDEGFKTVADALNFNSGSGPVTFTLKQLGLLEYNDCENDIFKIIKDEETLLILPDFVESDDNFEDYIKKSELNEYVKKSLQKKYNSLEPVQKSLIKNQTYMLRVMTRNKKSTESMKNTVMEALEELDRYLQGRLYDEANRSSRNGTNINRAIKKIFFFTDNEGKWSLHHFDKEKYNKSIVQILSDSFEAYTKESKSKKDDTIGIQIKQMDKTGRSGVRIPSYFKMSFKEVFKEKGGSKSDENYDIFEFEHFVLTEELKGIFDPAYIKSYSVDDADAKSVFEVIYKYNIETDKDPYYFKKIVMNTNKTYILVMNSLSRFVVYGYFQGRSKNYKFKITRIEPNFRSDPSLDFCLTFMTKYNFSYSNVLYQANRPQFGNNDTLSEIFGKYINENLDIPPLLRDIIRIINENTDETYIFLKQGKNSIEPKPDEVSALLDRIDGRAKDQSSTIDELIEIAVSDHLRVYYSEKDEGMLLYDLMKLNTSLQLKVFKKRGDDIHNFRVIRNKSMQDIANENVSVDKYRGVLKEYEPKTYYKLFSTNLIDTNLNPKKQINYYDDMKITKDNLQAFLLSKTQNTNKERKFNMEKELLIILTDTSLLNDFYNFVSEEYPNDILDEESYLSLSEINEFKYEVLEGIIDILFHVGTSFYVSNVSSKSTTNKVTTRGFSSYEISNIDDIIIISQYSEPPFDDEGVIHEYFHDYKYEENTSSPSRELILYQGGAQSTGMSIAREEIYKDTTTDKKYFKYQDYQKLLSNMKNTLTDEVDSETRSLVVLHFDLLYHKDVDKKSDCASRKQRITKKLSDLFTGFKAYTRNATRTWKPKIKNSRGGGTKKIKK